MSHLVFEVCVCCTRYKGVSSRVRKSYASRITIQGRQRHLGVYSTPDEAARVYDEACIFQVSQQTQKTVQVVLVIRCMALKPASCCPNASSYHLPWLLLQCKAPAVIRLQDKICNGQHGLLCGASCCLKVTMLCDCRRETLSIFPSHSMMRLPYFRSLTLTPLSNRKRQQAD